MVYEVLKPGPVGGDNNICSVNKEVQNTVYPLLSFSFFFFQYFGINIPYSQGLNKPPTLQHKHFSIA